MTLRARLFGHRYGHVPDVEDTRDVPLLAAPRIAATLPDVVLVRDLRVRTRDQGRTSACGGFAVAAGLRTAALVQGIQWPEISPRAVYGIGRAESRIPDDSGSRLRDTIRAIRRVGVPSEMSCPWSEHGVLAPVPFRALQDGFDRRGVRGYYRCDGTAAIMRALASGLPVVAGFPVDDHVEGLLARDRGDRIDGVRMGALKGWHAMVIEGYDRQGFSLWNTSWGGSGRFPISHAYAVTARDAWALDVRAAA